MLRLFVLAGLSVSALWAQAAATANEGYQTEADRARVAAQLDSADREQRQKPRELIAALDVKPGMTVADVGTGVGFMIPYFLEAVGPHGKLVAQDIQQDFLNQVGAKKSEQGWKNVETVLGGVDDPKLPKGKIDLAFILDAYHHFDFPEKSLARLRESLSPGGRLVVVDFYRSRPHPTMSPERLEGHIRKDRDGFAEEIEQAGFTLVSRFDHLPYQYALIFEKAE
jgi:ubiquinone/menaquinone biosynthesis C-methylase UbiE